jgi:hypothetical protein
VQRTGIETVVAFKEIGNDIWMIAVMEWAVKEADRTMKEIGSD